jgi:hypothetical protein
MTESLGRAKTVQHLLHNTKYSIDYYQRGYKWESNQIQELIEDVSSSKCLDDHDPADSREHVGSYGALEHTTKLDHYSSQNPLARSLHPKCYDHNPGFLQFTKSTKLPFLPHDKFGQMGQNDCLALYRKLASETGNPPQIYGGTQ